MPEPGPRATSIAIAAPQNGARRLRAAIERWLELERDQLAPWLPVGLGAGVTAWLWLPDRAGWIAFLLGATGVAGAALAIGRGGRAGRALAWFAIAAALGCALVWARAERLDHRVLGRARVARFAGRIASVERLPARDSVRIVLVPVAPPVAPPVSTPALPERVRVSIRQEDAPAGLARGALLAVRARLVPPAPPAVPGAYDYARNAWFDGVGASGKALDPPRIVAPARTNGPADLLARWREALAAHILARLGGGEGGVAAALAMGDQGAIPDADTDAMRRAGLAHLLSVSGLHLTAVVGATMLLTLRLLALWPRFALRWPLGVIAAGAGAFAGIGYTLLTGLQVPTLRSLAAALLVLAGVAVGREAVTLRLVATGALVLLLVWPESLAGPSFQLSFAAVTAIIALHEERHVKAWFARRDEPPWRRLAREAASLLLTGLVVELALAPIALFHFHRAGLYGAMANIVAIPLTTFVIMPLEAGALLLDVAGAGAPLWWLAGRALGLLLALAHATAAIPGAVTMLPAASRAAYALAMAGALWLALWTTRARIAGGIALLAGIAWMAAAPAPDLLITGDGRHVAVRGPDGRIALLRERTGAYVRDTLAEVSGEEGDTAGLIEALPDARCGRDMCAADIMRGGRRWRLLAARSPYLIGMRELARACAAADIVVADRRLPASCRPRWLKADAPLLARTGGLAAYLGSGEVVSVADLQGAHPWAVGRGGAAARPSPE